MKTIDIKGKQYITVNERLKYFRENFEGYAMDSIVLELNEDYIVIKACIYNKDGRLVASGTAREVNGDSYINKTSFVENAETSAWGRALANFGIGIDASVASADEVTNAINNSNKPKSKTKAENDKIIEDVSKMKTQDDLKALYDSVKPVSDYVLKYFTKRREELDNEIPDFKPTKEVV